MTISNRNRIAAALTLLLAAACAPGPSEAPTPRPLTLGQVVDSVVSTPPLDRTHWGIMVYDPAEDRVLYEMNARRHFVPASNNKLMIGAAALGLLGPDYRFRTDLYALDAAPGDTVAGSLLLIARGDPTLSERFNPTETAPLDSLADSLALAGIRRVAGHLVVDASYFDDEVYGSSWSWGWAGGTSAAPVAAFGIDEGIMRVRIGPGAAPGDTGIVEVLAPPGAVVVLNRLVTGEPEPPPIAGDGDAEDEDRPRRPRVRLSGRPGTDTLVVEGVIPLGAEPRALRRSVGEPASFAAHALGAALESRGIAVEGAVRVSWEPVVLAPDARRAATWTSPPLHEIVAGLLRPSQNWITEHLAKTLGAERGEGGTWDDGLDVVETFLFETAGVDSGSVDLEDGSGLSHRNLVAPESLVRLLAFARTQPWGDPYREGLPTPGGDGTLRRRLAGLEEQVSAKTGTIANVNALSGYVTAADGRELIFSILTNASGRRSGDVRDGIDRIVRRIAAGGL